MPEASLHRPIVILGAPRSGTSLLQRILRGCDGCGSVAAESAHIWRRYTHPRKFDWAGEGWDPDEIDARECARIHRRFQRSMLPAATWRRIDAARVVERQRRLHLPRWLLRAGYTSVVAARNAWRPGNGDLRLVEKSVHAGLWPGLPARVFPDATFVHVVRAPAPTMASMRRGWRDHDRFRSYRLPEPLSLPDCAVRDWCFPLPAGWRDYVARPLADVVAFQWCSVQRSIRDYLADDQVTSIQVRLEDLVADPAGELTRLAEFLGLPWDDHLQGFATDLPRVNAGAREDDAPAAAAIGDPALAAEVERLARELGD